MLFRSQAFSGRKSIQLGNVNVTRDFTYITDTVNGFIQLAGARKTEGNIYNVGCGREVSIKNLVQIISETLRRDIKVVKDKKRIRPKNSEVERLLCDSSKIKEICGWKARVSLEEGLRKTCRWISDNPDSYKAEIYNV